MWDRGYQGSLLLQDQEILQRLLFQELLLQLQESQYLGEITGERQSLGRPFLGPWVLSEELPTVLARGPEGLGRTLLVAF